MSLVEGCNYVVYQSDVVLSGVVCRYALAVTVMSYMVVH